MSVMLWRGGCWSLLNDLCAPALGILSTVLDLFLLQMREIMEGSNKKSKALI